MARLATSAGVGLGSGAVVAGAHALAHRQFGEAGSLEAAAVSRVGAVVFAGTSLVTGLAYYYGSGGSGPLDGLY